MICTFSLLLTHPPHCPPHAHTLPTTRTHTHTPLCTVYSCAALGKYRGKKKKNVNVRPLLTPCFCGERQGTLNARDRQRVPRAGRIPVAVVFLVGGHTSTTTSSSSSGSGSSNRDIHDGRDRSQVTQHKRRRPVPLVLVLAHNVQSISRQGPAFHVCCKYNGRGGGGGRGDQTRQ